MAAPEVPGQPCGKVFSASSDLPSVLGRVNSVSATIPHGR